MAMMSGVRKKFAAQNAALKRNMAYSKQFQRDNPEYSGEIVQPEKPEQEPPTEGSESPEGSMPVRRSRTPRF
jgi:hypothetical protein